MHTFAKKMARTALALAVAVGGLTLTGSLVSAAAVSIELCAVAGTATLTGSITAPIWGFGVPSTPGDCTTATASLPGPLLSVNEGDSVTLTVRNALPGTRTLTLEAPGVAFDAGPTDAAAGASVTRTFTAGAPGTYLYESAGDGGRQAAMGLYGALIVRSLTIGQAYDAATTAYDVEATLVFSQIDLNFNAAPDSFNMKNYLATYWLINGKAYPDTAPGITAAAGQKLLLRYVNAGYDNTSMLLLGMHAQVLARDARLLNNPLLADAETIPAGATEDAIATVPAGAAPSANGFALYNRNLHDTNGSTAAGTYATPGGMLIFIHP